MTDTVIEELGNYKVIDETYCIVLYHFDDDGNKVLCSQTSSRRNIKPIRRWISDLKNTHEKRVDKIKSTISDLQKELENLEKQIFDINNSLS